MTNHDAASARLKTMQTLQAAPAEVHGTVICDDWGWHVEFYRDDDSGSGYGDNPQRAFFYEDREVCEYIVENRLVPRGIAWQPIEETTASNPGSAAWCETYGDNH